MWSGVELKAEYQSMRPSNSKLGGKTTVLDIFVGLPLCFKCQRHVARSSGKCKVQVLEDIWRAPDVLVLHIKRHRLSPKGALNAHVHGSNGSAPSISWTPETLGIGNLCIRSSPLLGAQDARHRAGSTSMANTSRRSLRLFRQSKMLNPCLIHPFSSSYSRRSI